MIQKILFIDPIDKGYRNFLRLNAKFKERGYDTLLVHASSFHQPIKDVEYQIEGLLLRDISYYKTKLFRKVIEREKPSIILIVNLSFVLDRAIINVAKEKNIKIVYLAHGSLTRPSEFDKARENLDKKIKGNARRIFSKKNFFGLLNYLDSHKAGKKFISFIKLMIGIMKHPAQYLTLANYEQELDVDLMLVYEKKDKVLLSEKMNFPANKIKVVGNPEISEFFNLPLHDKSDVLSMTGINTENYVVYLDDGLVANKIWDKDEWYNHLLSIAEITNKQQMQLVVKLHPRMNLNDHMEFFNSNKQTIIPIIDTDFKNLLSCSILVISHYSTTIVYALLFKKKVIIPKWSDASRLLSNKYPQDIVSYCYDISIFEEEVCNYNLKENDINNIMSFLEEMGVNTKVNSINLIVDSVISDLKLSDC